MSNHNKVPEGSSSRPFKSNKKEIVMDSAMLVLDALAEFSDALPPLKTVTTALKFIVDRAEKVKENHNEMQNLAKRIRKVANLTPRFGDDAERERREILRRELEEIANILEPLRRRNIVKDFLKASRDKATIEEYITKVEQALLDYQASVIQDLYRMNLEQINYDEQNALDKLTRAKDAVYNAFDDRPRCLKGTRVEVQQALEGWAADPGASRIYWLNGIAGSGKSAIAQSFAESLSLDRRLGASFFCSRDSMQRSDLKMIFPTIAFHLARADNPNSSKYRKALLQALKNNPDIASLSLRNQIEELIAIPVKRSQMATVVVIDALDECKETRPISIILELLSHFISQIPTIQWFITSRPEPHIRSGFRLDPLRPITETMILHEIDEATVSEDIRLFIKKALRDVAKRRLGYMIAKVWPTSADVNRLTEISDRLFIFASTAVKFIDSAVDNPRDRLRHILDISDRTKQPSGLLRKSGKIDPYGGLDILHLTTLQSTSPHTRPQHIQAILDLLITARDPLSTSTTANLNLLGLPGSTPDHVNPSSRTLHPILSLPNGSNVSPPRRLSTGQWVRRYRVPGPELSERKVNGPSSQNTTPPNHQDAKGSWRAGQKGETNRGRRARR